MKSILKLKHLFAFIFVAITTCNTHRTNSIGKTNVEAEQLHTYFWANFNQFRGNSKQASSWYQSMVENNPPLHTYPGYIHHLDEIGNYQKIVDIYPNIKDAVQDNPKIQLIHALALAQVGRINASNEELIRLQRKFKSDKEIAFYTANTYLQAKEPENALLVIDEFLKVSPRRPQNFVFYFMKSQIYAQLNKYDDALENIKLAVQLHPQFDKGWLLLALLEEQAGKLQEAINGYTSYLETSQEPDKNIEQHLLELALKQEIAQRNKRMISLDPACFEKAVTLFERRQYRQALSTVNECLKDKPEDVELRLLKLRSLMAMEQQSEAIRVIAQWIHEKPQDELWYKTLHLLVRATAQENSHQTDMLKEAMYALKRIKLAHPQELLPTLYLADFALRLHPTEPQQKEGPVDSIAQDYLEQALELTDQKPLKVKILFQLGLLHLQNNDAKRMGAVLEQAHELDPNFIPVINLLAHHLTAHDQNHERALGLISNALKKHPHNLHLLDTQATIYANQNKHQEAQEIRSTLAKKETSCPGCQLTAQK